MRRKRDIAAAYSTACERVYQYPLGDSRTGVWIGWRDALAWVLTTAIAFPATPPMKGDGTDADMPVLRPTADADSPDDVRQVTPPPSSASGGGEIPPDQDAWGLA